MIHRAGRPLLAKGKAYKRLIMAVSYVYYNSMLAASKLLMDRIHLNNYRESAFNSACEVILEETPVEVLAEAVSENNDNYSNYQVRELAYVFLSSPLYRDKLLSLCFFEGSTVSLYNCISSLLNSSVNVSRLVVTETLLDSLSQIIKKNERNIRDLDIPKTLYHSDAIFMNMVNSVGDIDLVMSAMNLSQLLAAGNSLSSLGYPEFYDARENLDGRRRLDFDDSRRLALFEVMKATRSPVEAQKEIDELLHEGSVLISLDELRSVIRECPVEFLDKALSSRGNRFDRYIRYAVCAIRNEGKLSEIDAMGKRKTSKLIKMKLITPDDFPLMEETMKNNTRIKLNHDFGI